ncbi:MAG: hypothetical protein CMH57_09005 [Myxococcales bacterium]|nr:hypothetical protein [Myxococcales bacterium]
MSSQLKENARKLNRYVLSALDNHVLPTAERLDEELERAQLKPVALKGSIEAVRDNLVTAFDRLNASVDEVTREVGEDQDDRGALKATTERAYKGFSELGRVVEMAYGRSVAQRLKLTGTTPRSPDPLLTRIEGFLSSTVSPPTLPEPTSSWNIPNLPQARAEFVDLAQQLKTAIEALGGEERETQAARGERDADLVGWQQEAQFATDQARAILKRAGQDYLADRILPTQSQIAEVEDPGEPPANPTEDDPAPTPAPAEG